jgi:hypothetical protein
MRYYCQIKVLILKKKKELCVLKCSQSKGIISAQSMSLSSATFTLPGYKQEKFGTNLAR